MEKAILKAMQGGWTPIKRGFKPKESAKTDISYATALVMSQGEEWMLLDPLWWQALGKAEGKENEVIVYKWGEWLIEKEEHKEIMSDTPFYYPWWHYQMRNFIDHLAEGKDINSFFNDLLTNTTN